MKTATQNLEHDHVYILQLTEIMQAMVEKEVNNIEHFELVVNLIRKFADGIHHAKENGVLFRMADQVLSDDEQSSLLIQFDEVEAETAGESSKTNSIAKITELAALYL